MIEQRELHELYYAVELPLCAVLARMEHTGMRVDANALAAFGSEMEAQLKTLEQRIRRVESLRRAMICIDDKNRPMVVLDIDGEDLRLSTKSGVGDYSETLRLEGAAGHAVKIGFNGRYLQECFKSYSGDVVECFFNGAGDAMVVDDGEVKSLVLPVRLPRRPWRSGRAYR